MGQEIKKLSTRIVFSALLLLVVLVITRLTTNEYIYVAIIALELYIYTAILQHYLGHVLSVLSMMHSDAGVIRARTLMYLNDCHERNIKVRLDDELLDASTIIESIANETELSLFYYLYITEKVIDIIDTDAKSLKEF